MQFLTLTFLPVLLLVLFVLANSLRVLREYERGVIFRLGRLQRVKGPGLILLIPLIDRMVKVSLRIVPMDVPPQDVITKDNVSVKVNAVIYFKVVSPQMAIVGVEDYLYATSQVAQTTLRSVMGQVEMDDLLSERNKLNLQIRRSSTRRPSPGASRSAPSRSRTSTCRRRCGAPWPASLRPSQAVCHLRHAKRPADEGDSSRTTRRQVLRNHTAARHIVDAHRRLVWKQSQLTNEHRRGPPQASCRETVIDRRVRRHDHSTHPMLFEGREVGVFSCARTMRVREKDSQAAFIRPPLHRFCDVGEVRVADIGGQVSDQSTLPRRN